MTRMWMGDPKTMCRNHLLGEHKEIHQLVGSIRKGYSVTGYIRNNCIEITSIQSRHDALVDEMNRRGYQHLSPIVSQEIIAGLVTYLKDDEINYKVDVVSSDADRFNRCVECNYRRE